MRDMDQELVLSHLVSWLAALEVWWEGAWVGLGTRKSMRMQISFVAIVTFPLLGAAVTHPSPNTKCNKSFAHHYVSWGQMKDILSKEHKVFKAKSNRNCFRYGKQL